MPQVTEVVLRAIAGTPTDRNEKSAALPACDQDATLFGLRCRHAMKPLHIRPMTRAQDPLRKSKRARADGSAEVRRKDRFLVQILYWQEKKTEHFCQVLDFITNFGRRDWTRTNDPHHVKVVL
jgi:hypothetical protein